MDSSRCSGHAEVEPVREPSDRRLGGTDVQPKRAAGEALGVEIAEKHACVGHRGLMAAPAVARRSRLGPRAHGPDPQATGRVEPGDAPTPGSNGVAIHHRRPHREPPDAPFARDQGSPSLHHADVVAGAIEDTDHVTTSF